MNWQLIYNLYKSPHKILSPNWQSVPAEVFHLFPPAAHKENDCSNPLWEVTRKDKIRDQNTQSFSKADKRKIIFCGHVTALKVR